MAAARAYDTAVFYLRGPTARLNFPELLFQDDQEEGNDSVQHGAAAGNMSADSIRRKATQVGARVDALQTALHHHASSTNSLKPDLNEFPKLESLQDWYRSIFNFLSPISIYYSFMYIGDDDDDASELGLETN